MITQAELRALMPHVLVVDVRSGEEFQERHIPNALHIPLSEIPQRLSELNVMIPIVTVCGKGGGRSMDAASLITGADWLEGGTDGFFVQ